MRKTVIFFTIAILLCLSGCGLVNQGTPVSSHKDNAGSREVYSADGEAIDFGIYCGSEVAEALVPGKPLSKYEGTIGVIVSSMRFPYGGGTKTMAEDTLETYFPNMEFIIGNGDGDPMVQSTIIDDYIAKGVDVLVIDPVEKEAMVPAFDRINEAGIPVVCVDRYVPGVPLKYSSVVKADDVKIGKKAGEYMAELLGGKGRVIEIQGAPAASNTNDRHTGFLEGIEGTEIEIIASPFADFLQTRGLNEMEDLLQRFPNDGDIDAIFSQSDVMTMGIIQALKAAGRDIPIVSIDAQESALEAVEAGEIAAVIAYPIPMPAGVFAGIKVMTGETIPAYLELECPVITKENVAEYKGHSGY
ncbi:substrate-binding domain-containing protein [Christensenellaceae bacterium OttesenSCG-928-K19]|nr:substrate-binding domain-containing protein [Christensenellaceae bacterium OttesenSCG-928-K19]